MSFFKRLDAKRFRPTDLVSGAWNVREQHVAPALGLLAHAIELDHAVRRDSILTMARVSYDILGTLPIDEFEIDVSVIRPGRTIELVEARLSHAARAIVIARAWLLQTPDTSAISGTAVLAIPTPETLALWKPETLWRGGFVRSIEVRRSLLGVGRAVSWIRSEVPLVAGESVSPTARALGIIDIANGLAAREDVNEIAFPNIDLTVHFIRKLRGLWLGLDTTVSFGPSGIGLTHSIVHDQDGPIGVVSQSLTIRH